jgi:hypothetical protein
MNKKHYCRFKETTGKVYSSYSLKGESGGHHENMENMWNMRQWKTRKDNG